MRTEEISIEYPVLSHLLPELVPGQWGVEVQLGVLLVEVGAVHQESVGCLHIHPFRRGLHRGQGPGCGVDLARPRGIQSIHRVLKVKMLGESDHC